MSWRGLDVVPQAQLCLLAVQVAPSPAHTSFRCLVSLLRGWSTGKQVADLSCTGGGAVELVLPETVPSSISTAGLQCMQAAT